MAGRRFTIQTALSDYFQGTMGQSRLRELIYSGEIPHWRNGNKIVIEEEDLDAWVRNQVAIRSGKKAQAMLKIVK